MSVVRRAVDHRLRRFIRWNEQRMGAARGIKWAADNGYRELTSEMVEGNAPMRALNERLGYPQLPPVIIVGGSAR